MIGDASQTHTICFQQHGDLQLHVDIYTPKGKPRGFVLFFHGGGGILGSRKDLIPVQPFLNEGYVFLSPDYRLAPETRLDGILADCMDAYHWARSTAETQWGLDQSQVTVAGFSFGAFVSLLLAATAQPRPKAALSFCGYGDLLGSMYLSPSTHYIASAPHYTWEYLNAQIEDRPLVEPGSRNRLALYLNTRQTAQWVQTVTGLNPDRDRERLMTMCPVRRMQDDTAPVFLYHGRADTDVSFEQSLLTLAMLKACGVRHKLIESGAGHQPYGTAFDLAIQHALTFLENLSDHSSSGGLTTPNLSNNPAAPHAGINKGESL